MRVRWSGHKNWLSTISTTLVWPRKNMLVHFRALLRDASHWRNKSVQSSHRIATYHLICFRVVRADAASSAVLDKDRPEELFPAPHVLCVLRWRSWMQSFFSLWPQDAARLMCSLDTCISKWRTSLRALGSRTENRLSCKSSALLREERIVHRSRKFPG